jgi:hypothetical protein
LHFFFVPQELHNVVVIVTFTVTNCTYSIRKHEEHSSKRKKRKDSPFLCLAISASRNYWTTEKPTLLLLLLLLLLSLSLSLVPQLASFKSEHTCQHQEAVIHIPHTKKTVSRRKPSNKRTENRATRRVAVTTKKTQKRNELKNNTVHP